MPDPVVVLIEDEPQIRRFLRVTLTGQGYRLFEAATGGDGIIEVGSRQPDVVILDLGLPDMDGSEVLERLRAWSSVPLIVLSVRSNEAEKVRLLQGGADDYVVKPFGMQELLARLRAALRRRGAHAKLTSFESKTLSVNFETRQVTAGGKEVHLTPKEFELLRQLVASAGRPLTHRRLLQTVWGPDYGDEPEYLRVMVNQLRKKIEADPAKPRLILTEPWVGYRFQPPKEKKEAAE